MELCLPRRILQANQWFLASGVDSSYWEPEAFELVWSLRSPGRMSLPPLPSRFSALITEIASEGVLLRQASSPRQPILLPGVAWDHQSMLVLFKDVSRTRPVGGIDW